MLMTLSRRKLRQPLAFRSHTTKEALLGFATIRPAHNGEGLLDSAHGYVVTRKEFDDLREFATLDEAKLYVESIYELERKD